MSEPFPLGAPVGGIVGHRQLIAVQTIDLGRLTHHPVPLVPSALVAVSGTGPDRDSNGSGKTTFLASVSLLLGDPEWRIATTGGADALGLLFDPDLSGDAAGLYDPARVGYVAGVFAHSTTDGNYGELTVWLRISAEDSPRLTARWAPGVHLAAEREDAATTWNALGRERQVGPTGFVEQLYGGTGRCLAYVSSRGGRDTDTSLMQLQARLSPARIGSELIVLLGLEHLIDGERELRMKLATTQQTLTNRIEAHEQQEREWSAALAEIEARNQARSSIAEGKRLWRLRIARRLLDAITESGQLDTKIGELEGDLVHARAAESDLTARIANLPDLAALAAGEVAAQQAHEDAEERRTNALGEVKEHELHLGQLVTRIRDLSRHAVGAPEHLTVDQAEDHLRRAKLRVDASIRAVGAAEAEVARAKAGLQAIADHGDVDLRSLEALTGAGVEVTSLLDGIVLDDSARVRWEPLFSPWAGALVVSEEQRETAVSVAPPGTVLVIADGVATELPNGIRSAPPGTQRFLRTLLERARPPYSDAEAGVVVAGGFGHELCGRDAAIARARDVLDAAEHAHRMATAEHGHAQAGHELAQDTLQRLQSASELIDLRLEEIRRTEELAGARRELGEAQSAIRTAQTALVTAGVRLKTAEQERLGLEQDHEEAARQVTAASEALGETREARERLDIDGWHVAWGSTEDEAIEALGDDDRQADTFRRRAAEQLTEALIRMGINTITGDNAPAPEITGVIRARSGLDEELPPTNDVRRFDTVVQPIVDWLDDHADHDMAFQDEVDRERQRWAALIDAARHESDTQTELLNRQRDMVEQQIEAAFQQVSSRYGELDTAAGGYGAQLRWRSIRPATPADLWAWEVTPEWRRGPGARWMPYTRQANSAMQKQHRTHLVLAALLAAEDPAGRVLIVDEAGNDFGREHLRQVLTAFARVANSHGVTVIAACQDKVLEEVAALGAARLLLWFERLSDASPLCRPTRVWGFDADGGRVELTRTSMEAGRLL